MARKQINLKKTHDIDTVFHEFLLCCKAKNLSNRTIEYYEQCFELFTNVVDSQESVEILSNKLIREFIIYLQNNTKCSPTSINTRLRGIRTFINWCFEQGYISKVKVIMLKTDKNQKEPYSDDDIIKLLKKPNYTKCSFSEYRNWCIVNVFVGTGMRLNTLINLKVNDVDFTTNTITMKVTKNRREQRIPISTTLQKVLRKYIVTVKPKEYLFTNIYGEQFTDNGVKLAIKKYNRNRGVKKTSIHLFRHTYAKHYLMSGGEAFRLQKLLGHSTLEMTKNYVNLYSSDLSQGYDDYSLLEKMSEKQRLK